MMCYYLNVHLQGQRDNAIDHCMGTEITFGKARGSFRYILLLRTRDVKYSLKGIPGYDTMQSFVGRY